MINVNIVGAYSISATVNWLEALKSASKTMLKFLLWLKKRPTLGIFVNYDFVLHYWEDYSRVNVPAKLGN